MTSILKYVGNSRRFGSCLLPGNQPRRSCRTDECHHNVPGRNALEALTLTEVAVVETIASVVLAVLNAGTRLYAAVLVAALATLFLPTNLLQTIGLSQFKETYRMELGVALVASGSLLSIQLVAAVANFVMVPIRRRRISKDIRRQLEGLTYEEKQFLRPYIDDGENSNYAQYSDGVANGLVAKRIVYRASQMSIPGTMMAFPYNLQAYAREELSKHPYLLD
jgi:hypothetical protein